MENFLLIMLTEIMHTEVFIFTELITSVSMIRLLKLRLLKTNISELTSVEYLKKV